MCIRGWYNVAWLASKVHFGPKTSEIRTNKGFDKKVKHIDFVTFILIVEWAFKILDCVHVNFLVPGALLRGGIKLSMWFINKINEYVMSIFLYTVHVRNQIEWKKVVGRNMVGDSSKNNLFCVYYLAQWLYGAFCSVYLRYIMYVFNTCFDLCLYSCPSWDHHARGCQGFWMVSMEWCW